MMGVDTKRINEVTESLDRLIDKVDASIDIAEARGLVVTLNQTARNLEVITEKLLKIVSKFD